MRVLQVQHFPNRMTIIWGAPHWPSGYGLVMPRSTKSRSQDLPEVPTMGEQGFPRSKVSLVLRW
jgi:tripartite-type tricarboxylate transporter receptor subunit TctC